jgi:TonB family protein
MRRIEQTFEAHRQNLVSSTEALQREEAQLSRMLEAESVDRAGASAQINRVIQARGDVERTNSAMTLEMREHLTRAQWMQLQASPQLVAARVVAPAAPGTATPFGVRGGVGGGLGTGAGAGAGGGLGLRGVPAAPPLPGAPVRIGGTVAQQSLISSVKPEYPPLARAAKVQANVVLEATISTDGTVADLKVVSGHPLLNDAALAAVRQWRYRPQLLNGQPVVVVTTVEVPFTLQ